MNKIDILLMLLKVLNIVNNCMMLLLLFVLYILSYHMIEYNYLYIYNIEAHIVDLIKDIHNLELWSSQEYIVSYWLEHSLKHMPCILFAKANLKFIYIDISLCSWESGYSVNKTKYQQIESNQYYNLNMILVRFHWILSECFIYSWGLLQDRCQLLWREDILIDIFNILPHQRLVLLRIINNDWEYSNAEWWKGLKEKRKLRRPIKLMIFGGIEYKNLWQGCTSF